MCVENGEPNSACSTTLRRLQRYDHANESKTRKDVYLIILSSKPIYDTIIMSLVRTMGYSC